MTITELLYKYWGFRAFRPLQEEIIESVIEKKDTLALLPTGGGKSLCYQVPGLYLEGFCLVITPLIALMKDQVGALNKKGIIAYAIYSGMDKMEIKSILDKTASGLVKFLYVSPERLTTDLFKAHLPHFNINLIAVDEAHCISQWGYDFRPPYLKIAEIREWFPNSPVLALTATATPNVVDDIIQNLQFKNRNIFRNSFQRENLIYMVLKEEDKLNRILSILNKVPGSSIIYVRNRKRTKEIALWLRQKGITAGFYNAGMTSEQRDETQKAWMNDYIQVVVATNAFGMGIDKPNVRTVIHIDCPDSLEAYFQEAGRAGRDGLKSYCVLLWENADLSELHEYIESSYPQLEIIKKTYNALCNYLKIPIGGGKEEYNDFDLIHFADYYSINPTIVFSSLRLLEKEGYITMRDVMIEPSKVIFKISAADLYRFQVENKKYDHFTKALARSTTGIFTDLSPIREDQLALSLKLQTAQVISLLLDLQSMGVINYQPRRDKPGIILNSERIDERYIAISPENYQIRKQEAIQRAQSVTSYITNGDICRSAQLVAYFGESNALSCKQCDVCISKNQKKISLNRFKEISFSIRSVLREKPNVTFSLLSQNLPDIRENELTYILKLMEEEGEIILLPDNTFIENRPIN